MTDTLLDAYEEAWRALRAIVERVDAAPEGDREAMREELRAAIDQAVTTRTRARETLAAQYGGYSQGDQVLFVREVDVGALSREMEGFLERWQRSDGGRALTADELMARVRPLLVEPGDPEAQEP